MRKFAFALMAAVALLLQGCPEVPEDGDTEPLDEYVAPTEAEFAAARDHCKDILEHGIRDYYRLSIRSSLLRDYQRQYSAHSARAGSSQHRTSIIGAISGSPFRFSTRGERRLNTLDELMENETLRLETHEHQEIVRNNLNESALESWETCMLLRRDSTKRDTMITWEIDPQPGGEYELRLRPPVLTRSAEPVVASMTLSDSLQQLRADFQNGSTLTRGSIYSGHYRRRSFRPAYIRLTFRDAVYDAVRIAMPEAIVEPATDIVPTTNRPYDHQNSTHALRRLGAYDMQFEVRLPNEWEGRSVTEWSLRLALTEPVPLVLADHFAHHGPSQLATGGHVASAPTFGQLPQGIRCSDSRGRHAARMELRNSDGVLVSEWPGDAGRIRCVASGRLCSHENGRDCRALPMMSQTPSTLVWAYEPLSYAPTTELEAEDSRTEDPNDDTD